MSFFGGAKKRKAPGTLSSKEMREILSKVSGTFERHKSNPCLPTPPELVPGEGEEDEDEETITSDYD